MRRRIVALLSVLTLTLAAPTERLSAEVPGGGKVLRLGFLGPASRSVATFVIDKTFLDGLRDLGWVEGHNLIVEWRYAEGRNERLPDLAAELVRLRVDMLVTIGTVTTRAALDATRTIPIVMVAAADPVASGLVASLARPGGNVTGVAQLASLEEMGKRLELLTEIVPQARRIAVLMNPANPIQTQIVATVLPVAAQRLGVSLIVLELRGPEDLEAAFAEATRAGADALAVMEGGLTLMLRARIAALAARRQLPAVYGLRGFVEAGGLMARAVDLLALFRRAATFVDKIARGAAPGDLPVEQPMEFKLFINLKTAKALGLTIPRSVLLRADEVIE